MSQEMLYTLTLAPLAGILALAAAVAIGLNAVCNGLEAIRRAIEERESGL